MSLLSRQFCATVSNALHTKRFNYALNSLAPSFAFTSLNSFPSFKPIFFYTQILPVFFTASKHRTHSNVCNFIRFMHLLHTSHTTPGVGSHRHQMAMRAVKSKAFLPAGSKVGYNLRALESAWKQHGRNWRNWNEHGRQS
jgi:hypothetical protein